MNILIVGCGKVGSRLASLCSRLGHDVSVIDQKSESFEGLSDDYRGMTVEGIGIDEDILCQAGIEGCDAIAAVTQDDNINIMVCQIASEIFKVPLVLTRVYDPIRESVFSQFNIKTICPTELAVSTIYSMLTEDIQSTHIPFEKSLLSYSNKLIPFEYIGRQLKDLPQSSKNGMLFGVLRESRISALAHQSDYFLEEGDKLVYTSIADQLDLEG